jgi:integrase
VTNGTSDHHETQLRPFAVREVQAWIAERVERKIPGALLFPASLQGGALDKAAVYRQVKAAFTRAGLDVERRGGRTLRNTFAVRELEAGQPLEHVKALMGHRELRSTEKYVTHKTKKRQKLLTD